MFARSFRSLLLGGKRKPFVKANKAAKARKKVALALESLEDRLTPSTTITQWSFGSAVGAPDNSPAPTTGSEMPT